MIRLLIVLLFLALPATAQEPILRVEIDETEAIPGQAVSLRLTVLVPTFLPDPPVWPSFEAPNLLVRIASTGPVSERMEGDTWSGVSRRYLLAPMLPGSIAIPAQDVAVTWANPETNAPLKAALSTEAFAITGVVPDGAEGLDPFIAADALTLEQTVDGTAEGMAPGDSVIRTVTATIEGTSPMFVPPLLLAHDIEGVRAYPDEPVFAETSDRGAVRGTRIERVTMVAEGGGAGTAPEVTLDWYNLGTGTIETAQVPSFEILVDGPPAATSAPEARNWRALGLAVLAGAAVLAVFVLAARRLAPPVVAWGRRRHADWLASETWAWQELRRTVSTRDHAALRPALDTWAARASTSDPRQDPRLASALTGLGAARYGNADFSETESWRRLDQALTSLRRTVREVPTDAVLLPLNSRS